MAKERYIDTKFWDDPYITELKPEEKFLFIYFITNPLTNICGIYEISIKRMAFDTGIKEEIILKILEKFEKDKKIKHENGYIAIKSFIKHQKENPKIRAGISYELKTKPESLIDFVETLDYIPSERKFKRKPISKTLRKKVFEKYNNRCFFCGNTDNLEIDHIIPVNQGGNSEENNLRVLCQSCNGRRNAGLRWSKEENGWVIDSHPIGNLKIGRLSHLNSNTNYNSNNNTLAISFNFETRKWENITKEDIKSWEETYPACSIKLCLSQMREWLIANPKKKKSNYRRFIINWLNREQDRGGTKNYLKKGNGRTKKYSEREYSDAELIEIKKAIKKKV